MLPLPPVAPPNWWPVITRIGRDLAERAGVSHTTINRFLNGGALPDIGTVIRLEVALGTDVWPGISAVADVPLKPRATTAVRKGAGRPPGGVRAPAGPGQT
jgi:transcriptional regulator with XRE-family HTH domain